MTVLLFLYSLLEKKLKNEEKEERTTLGKEACGVSNTLLLVNYLSLFRLNTFLIINVVDLCHHLAIPSDFNFSIVFLFLSYPNQQLCPRFLLALY